MGGFWGSGPLGEGDGGEVVGMVSSSSSLLRSLGKALLPQELWIQRGFGAGGGKGQETEGAECRCVLRTGGEQAKDQARWTCFSTGRKEGRASR